MYLELCLFLASVSFAYGDALSTSGLHRAKVYEFFLQNENQANVLLKFEGRSGYDIWQFSKYPDQISRIMVSGEKQQEFEEILRKADVDYKVTIENVQKALENEYVVNLVRANRNNKMSFDAYHRYDQIVGYMRNLSLQHPALAKLETVGVSYENRTMYALRISNKSSNRSKPQLFIDGGIHAREWIAPAVALFVIHQLLENPQEKYLLDKADWLVLPVVNPDGYEYSHTTDRLWRKTRSILTNTSCIGVDGNRNYGYEWGGQGSSFDPCSNVYSGPKAFSETEIRAVRDLLLNEKSTKLYLTLHSHGNLLLYPWGFTNGLPQDWPRLHSLARDAAGSIERVNGTRYKIGSSALALGMSAGSSRDYARGAANIRTPYTVELPAGGQSGFELPPEQILPAAKELFEGIKHLVNHINE